jgi:phytoene/squalene synthetase
MTNTTAALARSITWDSSKQSYLTARLLADRDLADDCLRAYAYFRWADDTIDVTLDNITDRSAFIERQKTLVERLYRNEWPDDLSPEEQMLADLIVHDRGTNGGLRSFINNFMSVIEFDANRNGRLISRHELAAYTVCLGTAVMDGLQYFIGNSHPYPKTPDRNLAVIGAHVAHMLRDTLEDFPAGFVNIPAEDLAGRSLRVEDTQSEAFRLWVREQVELARRCFREGRDYIDSLEVLRCKLAGVWYCARFECILNAIERDGYRLRGEYPERQCLATWIKMIGLGCAVTLKHFAGRIRRVFPRLNPREELDTKNIPSFVK